MGQKILNVEEAAKMLKVSPDAVGDLLQSGDIPGKQIAGEWRTTSRALVNYVDGLGDGVVCCPPGTTCCTPAENAAGGSCC